jgi:ABC-type enterochelin transport system substrate-binding protein
MSDLTSVTEAIKAQTQTISSGLPDQKFYDEIGKAISTSADSNSVNTQAIRALLERIEPNAVQTDETLTQKAFKAVKGVRESIEELYTYVEKFSNEKDPSTGSLFEMQYKVMKMSIMMDVSSKVGDKGSQAFQTLFRNQ